MATTYQAKANIVKVAVGPATGNRVARIIRAGGLIPEGVEQEQLDSLEKRGLIEKVKATRSSKTSGAGSQGGGDGGDSGEVKAPAANAGEDKWREYATVLGIDVPADADKAKIREMVDAHDASGQE